ncbi:MAG: hypothetical protein GY797_18850, partial [Deltaproteobacteria bacterium]|nr:hypothetical protein [Deltaproteobacteria bacterium]
KGAGWPRLLLSPASFDTPALRSGYSGCYRARDTVTQATSKAHIEPDEGLPKGCYHAWDTYLSARSD